MTTRGGAGGLMVLVAVPVLALFGGLIALHAVSAGPSETLSLLPLAGLILLGCVLLGAALVLARSSSGSVEPSPAPAAARRPAPMVAAAQPVAPDVAQDRDTMIRAMIELRDQIDSVTLGDLLDRTLASAGVTRVSGDGEEFDARIHHAVGSVATDDPQLQDFVASTERPGYSDRGRLVRPPHVLVYALSGTDE